MKKCEVGCVAAWLCAVIGLSACVKLPFGPPGPGEAVKGFYAAMAEGRYEDVVKYKPQPKQAKQGNDPFDLQKALGGITETMERAELQYAAAQIKENGGIKSISIDREDIAGDTANVNFTLFFGNKTTRPGQLRCVRESGVWKIAQ